MEQELNIAIADLAVRLTGLDANLSEALRARYSAFLAGDQPPLLTATIQVKNAARATVRPDDEIAFEGQALRFLHPDYQGRIDLDQGKAFLKLATGHPEEDIDYFLRVVYAVLAFQQGGLLFHAAGVVRDGCVYAFFGPSGSGKTTISRLSPSGAVLNDDLLVLMPEPAGWTAHATPFTNPSQVTPHPLNGPVVALHRLQQAETVARMPLQAGKAVAELLANTPVISADPGRALDLIARCQMLCLQVPVYNLCFRPDASFWDVVVPG